MARFFKPSTVIEGYNALFRRTGVPEEYVSIAVAYLDEHPDQHEYVMRDASTMDLLGVIFRAKIISGGIAGDTRQSFVRQTKYLVSFIFIMLTSIFTLYTVNIILPQTYHLIFVITGALVYVSIFVSGCVIIAWLRSG